MLCSFELNGPESVMACRGKVGSEIQRARYATQFTEILQSWQTPMPMVAVRNSKTRAAAPFSQLLHQRNAHGSLNKPRLPEFARIAWMWSPRPSRSTHRMGRETT